MKSKFCFELNQLAEETGSKCSTSSYFRSLRISTKTTKAQTIIDNIGSLLLGRSMTNNMSSPLVGFMHYLLMVFPDITSTLHFVYII